MRAHLIQASPRPRDLAANVAFAAERVRAAPDADLVVFPELFLSGYQTDGLDELALAPDDGRLEPLRRAALNASAAVVVGAPERTANGVANSALCFDAGGEWAGSYRKTHLFGSELAAFEPGDELAPIELGGRSIGIEICFDMEFPEVARTLRLAGAEVLVTISANMEPFGVDHAVYARARALENGMPHLYVNRCGVEAELAFTGASVAIDPDGRELAAAGRSEELLSAGIGQLQREDPRERCVEQRRAQLYRGWSG